MRVVTALAFAALLASCQDPSGRVGRSRPAITADPLALDFGALKAGSTKTLSVALSNSGSADLVFTSGEFRGSGLSAFAAGTLPERLVPGAAATVEVTFTAPDLEGAYGAQWVILSDANNSPELALSLSGRSVRACAEGLSQCNGACVDLQASPLHCGTCDTACVSPETCIAGACECIAKTCNEVGQCGSAPDGCGGTLNCGTCAGQDVCTANKCVPPSCSDGLKNQGESDVDCGGPCTACGMGKGCATRADCAPGAVCTSGSCSACTATSECPSDQVCRNGVCGDCQSRAECGGGRACIAGQCRDCTKGEAAFNGCGLCGGPALTQAKGAPCTLANGCASEFQCNADLTDVSCVPVAKNECGACAGPAVTDLGQSCSSPQSSCDSALVCTANNLASVCQEVPRNECSACGGPALPDFGKACTSAGSGCAAQWACSDGGMAVECPEIPRNACQLCGGPDINDLDAGCNSPLSQCPANMACNDGGTATFCPEIPRNECGVCAGPPVSNLDAGCSGPTGCGGKYECDGGVAWCNAPDSCFLANHVVISQLCGSGPNGADDEFVELYNPTDQEVKVAGWRLAYHAVGGAGWNTMVTFPSDAGIAGHGYLLNVYSAVSSTYSFGVQAPKDYGYTANSLSAQSGSVRLELPGGSVVDLVGYGATTTLFEQPDGGTGTAQAAGSGYAAGKAVLRRAQPSSSISSMSTGGAEAMRGNGMDTDDNGSDFLLMPAGTFTPRNSSTTATP